MIFQFVMMGWARCRGWTCKGDYGGEVVNIKKVQLDMCSRQWCSSAHVHAVQNYYWLGS